MTAKPESVTILPSSNKGFHAESRHFLTLVLAQQSGADHLAERSIKPFVMGRKNFLFANVPKGAAASATIYSLINTAIENQLDPFRYLSWVLETAPQLAVDIHPELAEKLIPMNAPDFCKAGVSA